MSKPVNTRIFVQVWLMMGFRSGGVMGVQWSYFQKQTTFEKKGKADRRRKSDIEKSSKVTFKYVS